MNENLSEINCVVKKPLEIRINDQKDSFGSGVVVVDVTLQSVALFNVRFVIAVVVSPHIFIITIFAPFICSNSELTWFMVS